MKTLASLIAVVGLSTGAFAFGVKLGTPFGDVKIGGGKPNIEVPSVIPTPAAPLPVPLPSMVPSPVPLPNPPGLPAPVPTGIPSLPDLGVGTVLLDFAKDLLTLPGKTGKSLDKVGENADKLGVAATQLGDASTQLAGSAKTSSENFNSTSAELRHFLGLVLLPAQILLWLLVAYLGLKILGRFTGTKRTA